jgi:hypothetical protein
MTTSPTILIADDDEGHAILIRENLEAAGFRREGTCREHLWVDGQRQDVVFHGLLRSDDVG